MTTSSAGQRDFFVESALDSIGGFTPNTFSATSNASANSTSADGAIEFPQFRATSGTLAQTARIAARLNAASVSKEEVEKLLMERQSLLDKLLAETITPKESIRLDYVRWSLGRIEDAKHGEALDQLDDRISQYENFLSELEDFKAALVRARQQRR
jgi:hypothetical protein